MFCFFLSVKIFAKDQQVDSNLLETMILRSTHWRFISSTHRVEVEVGSLFIFENSVFYCAPITNSEEKTTSSCSFIRGFNSFSVFCRSSDVKALSKVCYRHAHSFIKLVIIMTSDIVAGFSKRLLPVRLQLRRERKFKIY